LETWKVYARENELKMVITDSPVAQQIRYRHPSHVIHKKYYPSPPEPCHPDDRRELTGKSLAIFGKQALGWGKSLSFFGTQTLR
jgi:hypothetical protein